MAVSSPALPLEEQKPPTSGDAETRQQPMVQESADTIGDANGSNNMQTTSPNPSAPAEHHASAAKAAPADGPSAPAQTVPVSASNSNPITDLSSDANESNANPIPDNEGQTSTLAAAARTKGGASTSDRDQDDDKAAKKPKYALGQAIEKVRKYIKRTGSIICSSTSSSSHIVSHTIYMHNFATFSFHM